MPIVNALASIAVKDLASTTAWYEKVPGKPADSKSMPEVAEWKFQRGGWLQVYQLPERAGSGSFTLAVTNIENLVARLKAFGIDTTHRNSGPKVETPMIADPDGNHIAFAETRDPNMAH